MANTDNKNNAPNNNSSNNNYWEGMSDMSTSASINDLYRIAYCDDQEDEKLTEEPTDATIDTVCESARAKKTYSDMTTQLLINDEKKNCYEPPMLPPPVYMPTTMPLTGEVQCDNNQKQSATMWPNVSSWISMNNKKKNSNLNHFIENDKSQLINDEDTKGKLANEASVITKKLVLPKSVWLALFLLSMCLLMLWASLKASIKMIEIIDVRLARIDELTQKYSNYNLRSFSAFSSKQTEMDNQFQPITYHHRSSRPHLKELLIDTTKATPQQISSKMTDEDSHYHSGFVPWVLRKYMEKTNTINNNSGNDIINNSNDIPKFSWFNATRLTNNNAGSSSHRSEAEGPSNHSSQWQLFRKPLRHPDRHQDKNRTQLASDTGEMAKHNASVVHRLLPKYNSLIKSLDEYPAHATLWMSYTPNTGYAISNLREHAGYLCGATLIDSEWLVTAAHCFDQLKFNNGSLFAMLRMFRKSGEPRGATYTTKSVFERVSDESNGQTNSPVAVQVLHYSKHPSYKPESFSQSSKMVHDIALVRLGRIIKPRQHNIYSYDEMPLFKYLKLQNISSVSMANVSQTFIGQRCFVPIRDIDPAERFEVNYLNMYPKIFTDTFDDVSLPIIGKTDCQTKLVTSIGRGELCAGGELGRDACKGNGGSGLYCIDYQTNSVVLKGLASWGISCGQADVPGVYTDISQYRDWIKKVIDYWTITIGEKSSVH